MNNATTRNLAIVVAVLLTILVGLRLSEGPTETESGQALFADLRDRINSIDALVIDGPENARVEIRRSDSDWVVASRDGYPADVAKVRSALLAIADAQVVEQKTANPERYAAIGLQEPEAEGSTGVRLAASGEGETFSVIIGNAASGTGRYVRRTGDAISLLIDKNPDVSADSSGWLDRELLDIDTGSIASVLVSHADGEEIQVEKSDPEAADFGVADIPDGRELSYPGVANGIAGALNGLELEDIRPASEAEPATIASFTTFDGARLTVRVYPEAEDATWISIDVEADESGSLAEGLSALLANREFRIAAFRGNQLTRRWEDILKPLPDGEE